MSRVSGRTRLAVAGVTLLIVVPLVMLLLLCVLLDRVTADRRVRMEKELEPLRAESVLVRPPDSAEIGRTDGFSGLGNTAMYLDASFVSAQEPEQVVQWYEYVYNQEYKLRRLPGWAGGTHHEIELEGERPVPDGARTLSVRVSVVRPPGGHPSEIAADEWPLLAPAVGGANSYVTVHLFLPRKSRP